jgi:hypothetical protein
MWKARRRKKENTQLVDPQKLLVIKLEQEEKKAKREFLGKNKYLFFLFGIIF